MLLCVHYFLSRSYFPCILLCMYVCIRALLKSGSLNIHIYVNAQKLAIYI